MNLSSFNQRYTVLNSVCGFEIIDFTKKQIVGYRIVEIIPHDSYSDHYLSNAFTLANEKCRLLNLEHDNQLLYNNEISMYILYGSRRRELESDVYPILK